MKSIVSSYRTRGYLRAIRLAMAAALLLWVHPATAAECTGFHADVNAPNIAGQGQYAHVSPGEEFTVSMDYEIWNWSGCPTCLSQIVVGIGTEGQECLYFGIPGIYPGLAGNGAVTLTAPSVPGTYEIRWRHSLEFFCEDAIANFGLGQNGTLGYIAVGDVFFAGVTLLDIDGQGKQAQLFPGATFSVSADFRLWNWSGCTSCLSQIVIGIDGEGQECLYDGIPWTYPGAAGATTVTLTAPTTPGTYEVRWRHDLQFTCADAIAAFPLGQNGVLATITVDDQFFARVSNVDVGGQGLHPVVPAGETFEVQADYRLWSGSGCPLCLSQIVIGIDGEGLGCIYDDAPSTFPGASGTGATFLTAPTIPGSYEIRWRHDLQLTCADAIAAFPLAQNGSIACLTVVESTSDVPAGGLPSGMADGGFQVLPNPFQSSTEIRFEVGTSTWVSMGIHDASGRLVRSIPAARLAAGSHQLQWDGADEGGRPVAPGVYFARLQVGAETHTNRVLVIR